MGSLAKGRTKKTVKMKLREISFTSSLLQPDPRLILRSEKVAGAAKPAEGIVMQELPHGKRIHQINPVPYITRMSVFVDLHRYHRKLLPNHSSWMAECKPRGKAGSSPGLALDSE